MLQLSEVGKAYPARSGAQPVAALDGVSLSLAAGDFVAVQGQSGSGKSTLLLIAGGLLAPTSGRVLFENTDVYALRPEARARWRARNIGFVFQQFHLVPYLGVLDNVLAPALAETADVSSRDDATGLARRAGELVERFGLAARRQHRPAMLSAGEQQRTALARALLRRPKLLLCDEPTGNLDAENASVVWKCLLDFQRDGGAVLLVTHDAALAGRAQRALRLHVGRQA